MIYLKILILNFFILISSIAYSIESNDARSFIEGIGNQAIKILKIPVDDRNKRNEEFRDLLQKKFDMNLISKAILGKEILKQASEEQISVFAKTLEEHIVRVYTSQLGVYKGQVFKINETVVKKNDAFVYTSIDTGDTPSYNIVWRVRDKEDKLKVIDIAVEGVSLLRTKRADFKMLVDTLGLDGLIRRLKEMNSSPSLKTPGE